MTLLETVTAIRAENSPDADLQIARVILRDMSPRRLTPRMADAIERTAPRIAPRMAVIAGDGMAEALDRIKAELLEEAQIVIDAFVSVLHEHRARHEAGLVSAA